MTPTPHPQFLQAVGLVLWTGTVLRHVPSVDEVLEQDSTADPLEIMQALDWVEQQAMFEGEEDDEDLQYEGFHPPRPIEDVVDAERRL